MFLKQSLQYWWKTITVIGTPIILSPLIILHHRDAARCGYTILILIIYWTTEAIPIPVTSLLPLILFPITGVLEASEVAPNYFRDMVSLFFGSVALAYAIQTVNLHRRVASFVLTMGGSSIKWIMAGLMITTWLLSMWISNTAGTTVMLPIALAIADEYAKCSNSSSEETESSKLMGSDEQQIDISRNKADNMRKCLILSVAYSTIYGGLATIVGSAAPIFLKGYVDEQYAGTNFQLTFVNYSLVALPASALMLICCWIWLQIHFGLINWRTCRDQPSNAMDSHFEQTLKQQYNEQGRLRWNEYIVAGLFFTAVTLWITRDLGKEHSGWSVLFRLEYVSNGTVALVIGVLTMILPNDRPFRKDWVYRPIVDWTDFSKHFPWGTSILLGAGLSIAHAAKARTIDVHPAYLLIPSVLSLSQSYLLPFSSPTMSIIFSAGVLRTRDLIPTGIVMNVVSGLIILLAATTWMRPVFDLGQPFMWSSTHSNITN